MKIIIYLKEPWGKLEEVQDLNKIAVERWTPKREEELKEIDHRIIKI